MNDEETLLLIAGGAAAVVVGLAMFGPKSSPAPVIPDDPTTSYDKQENPEIPPRVPPHELVTNPYPQLMLQENDLVPFMEYPGLVPIPQMNLKLAYSRSTGHVYIFSYPERYQCIPINPWDCEAPPSIDRDEPRWHPTHFFIGPIFKKKRLLYIGKDFSNYTHGYGSDDINRVVAVVGPDSDHRNIYFQMTDMHLVGNANNAWTVTYGNGSQWSIMADGNAIKTVNGSISSPTIIDDPFYEQGTIMYRVMDENPPRRILGLGMAGKMTLT